MVESLLLIVDLCFVMVDALLLDFLLAGAASGGDPSRIRRHGAASSGGYGRPA
jgi:hypothetical protein